MPFEFPDEIDLEEFPEPGSVATMPLQTSHPDAQGLLRARIKNFSTPSGGLAELQAAGFEASHLEGGGFSIRKAGTQEPFQRLDSPDAELADFTSDIASDVGVGILSMLGLGAGAPAGFFGSTAGSAGGAALGRRAALAVGESLGIQNDPGAIGREVAIDAVAGSTGPILDKAARAAGNLLGRPFRKVRASKAVAPQAPAQQAGAGSIAESLPARSGGAASGVGSNARANQTRAQQPRANPDAASITAPASEIPVSPVRPPSGRPSHSAQGLPSLADEVSSAAPHATARGATPRQLAMLEELQEAEVRGARFRLTADRVDGSEFVYEGQARPAFARHAQMEGASRQQLLNYADDLGVRVPEIESLSDNGIRSWIIESAEEPVNGLGVQGLIGQRASGGLLTFWKTQKDKAGPGWKSFYVQNLKSIELLGGDKLSGGIAQDVATATLDPRRAAAASGLNAVGDLLKVSPASVATTAILGGPGAALGLFAGAPLARRAMRRLSRHILGDPRTVFSAMKQAPDGPIRKQMGRVYRAAIEGREKEYRAGVMTLLARPQSRQLLQRVGTEKVQS